MNLGIAIVLLGMLLGTTQGRYVSNFSMWLVKFNFSIGKEQCYSCLFPNIWSIADLPCVHVSNSTGRSDLGPLGCYIAVSSVTLKNSSKIHYLIERGSLRRNASKGRDSCDTITNDTNRFESLEYPNSTANISCEICNSNLCTGVLEKLIPEELSEAELEYMSENTLATTQDNTSDKSSKFFCNYFVTSFILVVLFWIFE